MIAARLCSWKAPHKVTLAQSQRLSAIGCLMQITSQGSRRTRHRDLLHDRGIRYCTDVLRQAASASWDPKHSGRKYPSDGLDPWPRPLPGVELPPTHELSVISHREAVNSSVGCFPVWDFRRCRQEAARSTDAGQNAKVQITAKRCHSSAAGGESASVAAAGGASRCIF
jgi:hypothetical protein